MKNRIYTDKDLLLSFNEQVVLFADEALRFAVKGLTHFDVNSFVYNAADMGESSISCDIITPSDETPAFDRYWYVDFRGERFFLSTLQPTCVKDTSSLQYKYSLIFKSQREDLKRYIFANYVTGIYGTSQPISYDFVAPLDVEEFVERMNINLTHYFGASVWQMILDPNWVNVVNQTIYSSDKERKTISFARETLWSILTGLYDIYGLRWKISNEEGIMTIRLGYKPLVLSHNFEYGKDNGLISIERSNTNPDVYTRIAGRGSSRNLPYRYFHSEASGYEADEDYNDYTELIPYTSLMPQSYREYIKGYNDNESSLPPAMDTYAYLQGYYAGSFNPVDYVRSESAEETYGIRNGTVANNEDIYPTIQGATADGLGALDVVCYAEQVLNDDYDNIEDVVVSDQQSETKSLEYEEFAEDREIISAEFSLSGSYDKVSFSLFQNVITTETTVDFNSYITVSVYIDGSVYSDQEFNRENTTSTEPWSQDVEFTSLPAGDCSILVEYIIENYTDISEDVVFTTGISSITKSQTSPYKQTFDIWIKNVFGSSQGAAEDDDTYMHRVWDALLLPNKNITVMFSDGLLAGEDYAFEVAKEEGTENYYIYKDTSKTAPDGVSSHWRLSLLKSDSELEATKLMLPNTTINASTGDSFFFTNIQLPHSHTLAAEERLEDYLNNELAKVSTENPTYAIKPSPIFLETFAENSSINTGVVIPVKDAQIFGSIPVGLPITNLTIEYTKDSILPKWDIVVSETPPSSKNTIQLIEGQINVLSSNLLSANELTEQVQMSLDERYIRKDGVDQTSYSKTDFKNIVRTTNGIRSDNFQQGALTGMGYSIYKDENDNHILEIDKLNIRKTLNVNELIINQVSIYGGKHIYSAAAMEVYDVKAELTPVGYQYRCYLDIKNGSVLNQFVSGDLAYCQRFSPKDNSVIKYYWKPVLGVGKDYILIDGSAAVGDGEGVPAVGDNIAQLGHLSNTDRQAALVIDQLNGGSVTQYAGINDYSLANKDYVSYGYDTSTGRAYQKVYGDTYIGGRNQATDNYISFDSSSGAIRFRGTISQDSIIMDASENVGRVIVDRGEWSSTAQYFQGNVVQYNGSSYICFLKPPVGTYPTNTTYWRIYAARGSDGTSVNIKEGVDSSANLPTTGNSVGDARVASDDGHLYVCTALPANWEDYGQFQGLAGTDAKLITLVCTEAVIKQTSGGTRTPTQIVITGVAQNTTITDWLYSVDNAEWTEDASTIAGVSRTGSQVFITSADIAFTTLTVKATDGVHSDVVTIPRLIDGSDAYNVVLSNENHTVPTDASGNVDWFEIGTIDSILRVYHGADLMSFLTEVYANISFSTGVDGEVFHDTYLEEISVNEFTTNSGYVDIDVYTRSSPQKLVGTKRLTLSKSKQGDQGAKGDQGDPGQNAIYIVCDRPNIVAETNGNTFPETIPVKFRLMNGNTIVPMSQITTKDSSLTNLTANADETDAYFYTVNITGFSASNVAEGYINVSLVYLGYTYTYSASVARAHNPVLVIKGSYIAGTAYSANYIQRDCVKYTDNNWYAARPTVGTTSTTWAPAEWEKLNSFKNVATDTLLAEEANIAGFIYQDEKMISQTGTINGDVSTNWSHKDFVPNIVMDGVTGTAEMRDAVVHGTVNASAGVIGLFGIDEEGIKYGHPEYWDTSLGYTGEYAAITPGLVRLQKTLSYLGSLIGRIKVGLGYGADPEDEKNHSAGYFYRKMTSGNLSDMYKPVVKIVSENTYDRNVGIYSNGAIISGGGVLSEAGSLDIVDGSSANELDFSFGNIFNVGCTLAGGSNVYIPERQKMSYIMNKPNGEPFATEVKVVARYSNTSSIWVRFPPGETSLYFRGYDGAKAYEYRELAAGNSMCFMLVWDGTNYYAQVLWTAP